MYNLKMNNKIVAIMLIVVMIFSTLVSWPVTTFAGIGDVNKLEFENLPVTKSGGGINEVRSSQDAECSGGKFYFLQADAVNPWVEFTVPVTTEGMYKLNIKTKDNPDRGIFDVAINGEKVATVDFYDSTLTGVYKEHALGNFELREPAITLRFTSVGRNSAGTSKYGVFLDYLTLEQIDPVIQLQEVKLEESQLYNKQINATGSIINEIRTIGGTSGGQAYLYLPYDKKYVSFDFDTPLVGAYNLYIGTKKDTSRGIYDVSISDVVVGEFDGYGANVIDEIKVGTVSFGSESGANSTIKLQAIGMNPASTISPAQYGLILDYLRFVPVDQDTDDGEEPIIEQQVWNNEASADYTEVVGAWLDAAGIKGHDESGVRMSEDEECIAAWGSYPMATANFEVYYWNPQDSSVRSNLRFSISSQDGNWRTTIDPNTNKGSWVKLATIAASEGTAVNVAMTAMTDGMTLADAVKMVKTTAVADNVYTPTGGNTDIAVVVNQLGYDLGKPKRATVVNVADGTKFKVINNETKAVDFTGTVQGGIANFSALEPGQRTDYYIECAGATSYVFTIAKNYIAQLSTVPALKFMSEARQDVFKIGGNTGYGWRDSHPFSFELNSLVFQYMANPALYDSLPYAINDISTCEYPELRVQNEPDLIWLIKFGALRYYDWGTTKNIDLHMLIKEQLAYFLYIYPEIKQYVDVETYIKIRDFTIEKWGVNASNKQWYPVAGTNHNLYSVQTVFGGLKGSQPPGHSIMPNLLMYEVAKRDNLGNEVAERFFDAAYNNTVYSITDIDINDPYFAKGQRMSEHILMEGLAYFQEMYLDRAPAGLKSTITSWADKTIARADNMWDMRKAVSLEAGDGIYKFRNGNPITQDYWTGAAYALADGQNPVPKNEPGNIAGIQAITYAAARVLDDPDTIGRLKEIGISAIDDMYGRNPTGRGFLYDFARDFEGAELGWWAQHKGGYGALERCTAVIDANPPEACYPYAPENYNTGYTEGWVAYNVAWNSSLAYAAADTTTLTVDRNTAKIGEKITITLDAPLNMDDSRIETGYVFMTDMATDERTQITVTENKADGDYFTTQFTVPNIERFKVSYGFGIFEHSVDVEVSDYVPVDVEGVSIIPSEAFINVGGTKTVAAVITPEYASNKKVSWSTDNELLATINETGIITAISEGTTKVIATTQDGDKTAECIVHILPPNLYKVNLEAAVSTLRVGESTQLSITGILGDNSIANLSDAQIAYSVAPGTMAKVTTEGIVLTQIEEIAEIFADVTLNGVTIRENIKLNVVSQFNLSYEFEQLIYSYMPQSVQVAVIGDNAAKEGKVLTFKPADVGAYIQFDTPNIPLGKYEIQIVAKTYNDRGVFQVYVDDSTIGAPVDTSHNTDIRYEARSIGEMTFNDTKSHAIKLFITGKGVTNKGYNLAIDTLKFTEVQSDQIVHKGALQQIILFAGSKVPSEDAVGYYDGQYLPSEVALLETAIQEAQAVYDAASATQQAVNEAVIKLNSAIEQFEAKKIVVDRSKLGGGIAHAEKITSTSYTASSWNTFVVALEETRVIAGKSLITQIQADEAEAALKNAVAQLKKKEISSDSSSSSSSSSSTPVKEDEVKLAEVKQVMDQLTSTEKQEIKNRALQDMPYTILDNKQLLDALDKVTDHKFKETLKGKQLKNSK